MPCVRARGDEERLARLGIISTLLSGKKGKTLTAILLRQIEQSCDAPDVLAVPAVMFLNLLCVAMLIGYQYR